MRHPALAAASALVATLALCAPAAAAPTTSTETPARAWVISVLSETRGAGT